MRTLALLLVLSFNPAFALEKKKGDTVTFTKGEVALLVAHREILEARVVWLMTRMDKSCI